MSVIGIVGCGKQAEKHGRALNELGAELRVIDVDQAQADALAATLDAVAVPTVDELLSTEALAGLVITTPTPSHGELAERAIRRGVPFFIEKPLVASTDEAQRIADLADEAGVPAMVGYVYRFVPAIHKAREAVAAGALGEITAASFRIGGRGNHRDWKHLRSTGGGAISEMMVHMLDLAIWMFGPVERVEVVRVRQVLDRRRIDGLDVDVDAEDEIIALVQCERGPSCLIQADFLSTSFLQHLDVQGTSGSAFASIIGDLGSHLVVTEATAGFPTGRTMLEPTGDLIGHQMAEFHEVVAQGRTDVRHSLHDSVLLSQALELVQKGIDQ